MKYNRKREAFTNMLLLYFQVLLPPYEEAIAIPPKDPPPQYVSAWGWHPSLTTLLPNLLQRNNLRHNSPFRCPGLLFVAVWRKSPLSSPLWRQQYDFETPFPRQGCPAVLATQRCVSAPIWFALSAIMCGTGLFNTVNFSVVLSSTDIPEILNAACMINTGVT